MPVGSGEAVSRDRFPIVVHVLLLRGAQDAEIFLLRRANTGFMDGYYVPPGGHVRAGELPGAAAARECREEVGMCPGDLAPACVLPYLSGPHQGLNLIFTGRLLGAEPVLAEPAASDATGWFSTGALPSPCAPWLTDALELGDAEGWYRELVWR